MRSFSKIAVAALLAFAMAGAALAQSNSRNHGAQRVKNPPNTVSDPYGERPTDPNSTVPCSQRPFAMGCDKRGFW